MKSKFNWKSVQNLISFAAQQTLAKGLKLFKAVNLSQSKREKKRIGNWIFWIVFSFTIRVIQTQPNWNFRRPEISTHWKFKSRFFQLISKADWRANKRESLDFSNPHLKVKGSLHYWLNPTWVKLLSIIELMHLEIRKFFNDFDYSHKALDHLAYKAIKLKLRRLTMTTDQKVEFYGIWDVSIWVASDSRPIKKPSRPKIGSSAQLFFSIHITMSRRREREIRKEGLWKTLFTSLF